MSDEEGKERKRKNRRKNRKGRGKRKYEGELRKGNDRGAKVIERKDEEGKEMKDAEVKEKEGKGRRKRVKGSVL